MEIPPRSPSDRAPPLPPEPSEAHFILHPPRPRRPLVRALGLAGAALGTTVTLVAAAAGGVVLHVGLPPARRITSAAVGALLADTFRGRIAVERIGSLRPDRVDGVDATVRTHDGAPVLLVHGVRARIALAPLLWSLVRGGAMRLEIPELHVDHVEALLEEGADGQLTIAEVFQPAKEGPPPPPTSPDAGIDLALRGIGLEHAWVHGAVGGAPPIDADVDGLRGAFALAPDRVRVDVTALRVATRGLPSGADVVADLRGRLDLPDVDPSHRATLSLSVRGNVAGARGRDPASFDVKAEGALPDADAEARVTAGAASVVVNAHATLPGEAQPETTGHVKIAARGIDARAFGGPASRLGLDARASLRVSADGAANGEYDVAVVPGMVAGNPTPAAHVAGTLRDGLVAGTAHVFEEGAPVDVRYDVATRAAGGPDVRFDLDARAADLDAVPVLAKNVQGSATIHVEGRAALGAGTLDAHASARAAKLAVGPLVVDRADVGATVSGPLAAPHAWVRVDAQGVNEPWVPLRSIAASAAGVPSELTVRLGAIAQDGRTLAARGRVDARRGIDVRDATVTVARALGAVTARARTVRSQDGRLDVEDLHVEGASGALDGEVHLGPGRLAARAHTAGLDLGVLAQLFEGPQSKWRGVVALDADVSATARETRGTLDVHATHVTDGDRLVDLEATLHGSVDRRALTLALDARDPAIGRLSLRTEGAELAGGALAPRSWLDATGSAHAALDANLAKALPPSSLADGPLDAVGGHLSVTADVARKDGKRRPTLALAASTSKLTLHTAPGTVTGEDGMVTVVSPGHRVEGLDARVQASLDAETGQSSLATEIRDATGALLTLDGATSLPMAALLGGDTAALQTTPMQVHAKVPLRTIDSISSVLGSTPVRGKLGLDVDANGTLESPTIDLAVQGQDIIVSDDPTPIPLGIDARVRYDGQAARIVVDATRARARVLDLNATLALRASDLRGDGPVPWNASADVAFQRFPVGTVADLVTQEVDGDLTGTVSLRDLHESASLGAKLDLTNVVVSGSAPQSASVTVDVKDGTVGAHATMKQPAGLADLQVTGGMTWGAEVTPSVDRAKPVDVKLLARNFSVKPLGPFVRDALSELDGVLNADTALHIDPGLKDGKMTGAIALDRGVVDSPAVGQQLHDIHARVYMKPWGVWNVTELSARGTTGRVQASAFARMNGFHVAAAEAHVRVAEGEKFPVTVQGNALGRAWGQIDATAKMAPDGKSLGIDVKVPKLHVELADAIDRAVQSTDPDPTIHVGVHDSRGQMLLLAFDGAKPPPVAAPRGEAPPPPPPLDVRIATHLGPDFEVRRGTMLKAYVTKGPVVDLDHVTKLSGALEIPRGYVELQGKRFQIEKGLVRFDGQPPDNPIVLATAVYEATDGTRVFADFVGPVKTGKLTLRSEPALGQNEILALLLFGSSSGTLGQSAPAGQQGNQGSQAASLAGGLVTEGLNKAISGVSGVEIQTKVDTGESGNPRPEVEVALSRRLTATVIYNMGIPPPGQNPDDTLVLLDWRFHRNYSTEVTLGDRGTTILDVTWKYRY